MPEVMTSEWSISYSFDIIDDITVLILTAFIQTILQHDWVTLHLYDDVDQGPFSISLLKLSQLEAKSWSQPSNLLQTGFLSYVQVNDLGEILTWDSS